MLQASKSALITFPESKEKSQIGREIYENYGAIEHS